MHEWPWPMALIIARVKEMWLLPLPPGRMQIERVVVLPILPMGSAMLTGWPDGTATFNRTAAQRLLIRIYMPCHAGGGAAASFVMARRPGTHRTWGRIECPNASKQVPNEFRSPRSRQPGMQAPPPGGMSSAQCRTHGDPFRSSQSSSSSSSRSSWHFSPPIPTASLRVTGPQVHACASDHAATKHLHALVASGGAVGTGLQDRERIAADQEIEVSRLELSRASIELLPSF